MGKILFYVQLVLMIIVVDSWYYLSTDIYQNNWKGSQMNEVPVNSVYQDYQISYFQVENLMIQTDSLSLQNGRGGIVIQIMIGIQDIIYSNSNWNIKLYVNQGNNKILILNYNSSYNFVQYTNPYNSWTKQFYLKVIRSKVITNLNWNDQMYMSLEFENILNTQWIIYSHVQVDNYDKFDYFTDNNNVLQCRIYLLNFQVDDCYCKQKYDQAIGFKSKFNQTKCLAKSEVEFIFSSVSEDYIAVTNEINVVTKSGFLIGLQQEYFLNIAQTLNYNNQGCFPNYLLGNQSKLDSAHYFRQTIFSPDFNIAYVKFKAYFNLYDTFSNDQLYSFVFQINSGYYHIQKEQIISNESCQTQESKHILQVSGNYLVEYFSNQTYLKIVLFQLSTYNFYLTFQEFTVKFFYQRNSATCLATEFKENTSIGKLCQCINGYTFEQQTNSCIQCHSDCNKCVGGNITKCTACNPKTNQKFILLKNQCYFCNINGLQNQTDGSCSCTNSTYQTHINSITGCKDCTYFDPNCVVCAGKQKCQSCQTGYMVDPQTSICIKCYLSCSTKCTNCRCIGDAMYSFIDDTNECKDCKYYDPNCQICQDKNTCSQCNIGYILDPDTKICLKCHSSCSQNCSNCRCINDPTNAFVDENIGCVDCTYYMPNCQKCLSNKLCMQCKSGYIVDQLNQCEQCHYTCLKCQDCYCSKDKIYTFIDKQLGCIDCTLEIPHCGNCTNKTTCNLCKAGYVLHENECISTQCSKQYYFSDYKCNKCPINCDKCKQQNTKIICLTCSSNYVLFQGTCIQRCQNQLYEIYNSFQDSYECKSCNESLTNCSKCTVDKQEFKCLSCNSGYFLNSDSLCEECHEDCVKCIGSTKYNCTTYPKNYKLNLQGENMLCQEQIQCINQCQPEISISTKTNSKKYRVPKYINVNKKKIIPEISQIDFQQEGTNVMIVIQFNSIIKCSTAQLASNIQITPLIQFINSSEILPWIQFNISQENNRNRVFMVSFSLESEQYFRVNKIQFDILRNKQLVNEYNLPLNSSQYFFTIQSLIHQNVSQLSSQTTQIIVAVVTAVTLILPQSNPSDNLMQNLMLSQDIRYLAFYTIQQPEEFLQAIRDLDLYNIDKTIKSNILVNKYTNSYLEPQLDNNFKILIPKVNLLINSGKKILSFLYQVAGILLLKIIGMLVYLVFKWFQDSEFVKTLCYFGFEDAIAYFLLIIYADLVFHMNAYIYFYFLSSRKKHKESGISDQAFINISGLALMMVLPFLFKTIIMYYKKKEQFFQLSVKQQNEEILNSLESNIQYDNNQQKKNKDSSKFMLCLRNVCEQYKNTQIGSTQIRNDMIKIFLTKFILVQAQNYPGLQIIMNTCIEIIYLFIIACNKAFKQSIRHIFCIIKQIIYVVAHSVLLTMYIDDSKHNLTMNQRIALNQIFIYIGFLYSTSVLCFSLFTALIQLLQKYFKNITQERNTPEAQQTNRSNISQS